MSRSLRVLPCLAVLILLALLGVMPGCTGSSPTLLMSAQASMAFQANNIVVTLESIYDPTPTGNETVEIVVWKSDPDNTDASCQKLAYRTDSVNLTTTSSFDLALESTPSTSVRRWNVCIKVTYADGSIKVFYGSVTSLSPPSSMELKELAGATECPCSCD